MSSPPQLPPRPPPPPPCFGCDGSGTLLNQKLFMYCTGTLALVVLLFVIEGARRYHDRRQLAQARAIAQIERNVRIRRIRQLTAAAAVADRSPAPPNVRCIPSRISTAGPTWAFGTLCCWLDDPRWSTHSPGPIPVLAPQSYLEVQTILSLLQLLPKVDKSTEPPSPADCGHKEAGAPGKSPAPTDPPAESDVCSICLSGYEGDDRLARLLPCNHSFHPLCIQLWFSSGRSLDGACPICKQPMRPPGTQGAAGHGGMQGRCVGGGGAGLNSVGVTQPPASQYPGGR